MNLYQHSQLATLQAHVDTETGEIDIDSFNQAEIALQDKQQAVVAHLKNETLIADMQKKAGQELLDKAKARTKQIESLKDYLLVNMNHHGISEVNAPDHTFTAKIKKNPPKLIVDDESLIPNEFMVTPPPPPKQIDKAAVKAALKAGEVAGAHLEQGERLEIK